MKHIFMTGALMGMWCSGVYAAKTCNISNTPVNTGQTYTYDASCYPGDGSASDDDLLIVVSACDMCDASSKTNDNGIVVVKSAGTVKGSFPSGGGLVTCMCSPGKTTYKCASGYYGTATSANVGCTACPSNARCSGGNNSTFLCNKGYYKSEAGCLSCPLSGTTSGTGATAITQCYLPSGTVFSDATGAGIYGSDCYWVN